jgi:hypothetical protein
MNKLFYKGLAVILCTSSVIADAQSDSAAGKLNFKLGVYYNSNLNYYGRTDSLRSSGIFPMAELWFHKKFYINAAPVFTNNSVAGTEYAGTVATAGFLYNNGKSSGHIYLVKPIYKDNSRLVQSALKAQLAANFTKLNKVLNITAGMDVKFSGNVDFGANIGLDHIYRKQFPDKSVLVIDPSAFLYAGTQRFTQTWYQKSSFLLFPGFESAVTEAENKFNILSAELSIPVIFAKGKWMVLATPAYVLPQNLVTIEGRPDISERGENMFYITVGTKISF